MSCNAPQPPQPHEKLVVVLPQATAAQPIRIVCCLRAQLCGSAARLSRLWERHELGQRSAEPLSVPGTGRCDVKPDYLHNLYLDS